MFSDCIETFRGLHMVHRLHVGVHRSNLTTNLSTTNDQFV